MAYTSTTIQTPTQPAVPTAPKLAEYTPPDVEVTKPGIDTANTQYVAPETSFQQNDVNTSGGLLDYTPEASKNLTFDGRDIDASAVGANIKQTTPEFATSDNFLSDGAFVENRVAGLLEDPNNTLMQRTKALGMREAGASGLRNTSMGATIGTAAMADKAIQIATPDATTQATADMTRQNATYGAQENIQNAEIQGSLAEQTATINSALKTQAAGNEWDSTKQKAAIQGDLNVQGAKIAGAKTTQQESYNSDARDQAGLLEGAAKTQQGNISAELAGLESVSSQNLAVLQNKLEAANLTTKEQNAATMQAFSEQQALIRDTLNNKFQQATSQAQLNAAQREALSGVMGDMANNYEISVQNIMLDPNLNATAKNAAIVRINKIFDQDMANISSVFGATYRDTKV